MALYDSLSSQLENIFPNTYNIVNTYHLSVNNDFIPLYFYRSQEEIKKMTDNNLVIFFNILPDTFLIY